jgi:ABC-type Mn2+/Zn2+ transport system permease subunit
VAALLVLPGAIGLQVSRRMSVVVGVAVVSGLVGAIAGPVINHVWGFVKEGPAIVLVLVLEFGIAYLWGRFKSAG